MHPADRPVRAEPALASGVVDNLAASRALGACYPLEDRRADMSAETVGCVLDFHPAPPPGGSRPRSRSPVSLQYVRQRPEPVRQVR